LADFQESALSTARKPAAQTAQAQPQTAQAQHPARPSKAALDLKSRHTRISKRFPKVLAELAK
jgi:hypothetical protein